MTFLLCLEEIEAVHDQTEALDTPLPLSDIADLLQAFRPLGTINRAQN